MNKDKANNKAKKDRPRSVDKGRRKKDGTPDKIGTPNPEEEEPQVVGQAVIDGEDVQSLAIKAETLEQIRSQALEGENDKRDRPQQEKSVLVRSRKSDEPIQHRAKRPVIVAKGAPPNAPLRPYDYGGQTGPRFDAEGRVIPHSILGNLKDYKEEAQQRGELEIDFVVPERSRVATPLVSYAKTKTIITQPKHPSGEESNALRNWQKKVLERKRQQGYISNLLQRAPEELVMNKGDEYRAKQEVRHLIDRTIPAVDYGKGYRVGSEFWNQQVQLGNEDGGIHTTLSKTQQGYPPPIEHVSLPQNVQQERGLDASRIRDERQHIELIDQGSKVTQGESESHPWSRCQFLTKRRKELASVINDLDPFNPDMSHLEVIGTNRVTGDQWTEEARRYWTPVQEHLTEEDDEEQENRDPLSAYPDVHQEPFFGPSLEFAGTQVSWTGDSTYYKGQVAVDARVTFEVTAGKRLISFLDINNVGTTAIYFDWKMLPKTNPFDLLTASVQRFYFDTSSGVILPGQSIKFPFVFKSEKPGIFTERWEFETRPVVSGGASLIVTLHGVALQEDKYRAEREEIEKRLIRNVTEGMIRKIIDNLVDSVQVPDRPPSPLDSYLTDEELFGRLNPQLYHHHSVMENLKVLYNDLVSPEDTFAEEGLAPNASAEASHPQLSAAAAADEALIESLPKDWNLSISWFKQVLLSLSEDNEKKLGFLEKVNIAVSQLSFPPTDTLEHRLFLIGYEMFSESVDQLVNFAVHTRGLMGLPEKETSEENTDEAPEPSSAGTSKQSRSARSSGMKTPRPDSKAEAKKGGKGGKDDAKEKKGGKDSKKDAKAAKESLPPKGKASPSKQKPGRTQSSTEGAPTTPGGSVLPPVPTTPASTTLRTGGSAEEKALEAKYKERVYSQTYCMLRDMVETMVDAFEEVLRRDDR